jgi:hypothetical protein
VLRVTARVTAEIDDEIVVELDDDDATDEEIMSAIDHEWSFVEGKGFETRIEDREVVQ